MVWLRLCRICTSGFTQSKRGEKKVSNRAERRRECRAAQGRRFLSFLSVNRMLMFSWGAARAAERRAAGGGQLFLLYANTSEVLPAVLANAAVNANQTVSRQRAARWGCAADHHLYDRRTQNQPGNVTAAESSSWGGGGQTRGDERQEVSKRREKEEGYQSR